MSERFRRLVWFVKEQLGLDIGKLCRALVAWPRYLRDFAKFRDGYSGAIELRPCLHDWSEPAGRIDVEYFLQDLYVARKIFSRAPRRHVDVGSRVDGFVAHVASFREIEVLDVRAMDVRLPGIAFRQADVMRGVAEWKGSFDSLSCLHALEHFGLGRYGDRVDPRGNEQGLRGMAELLGPGGRMYLSVPVGRPRVQFNAHRIFDPRELVALATAAGLAVESFALVSDSRIIEGDTEALVSRASQDRYGLGVFVLVKKG